MLGEDFHGVPIREGDTVMFVGHNDTPSKHSPLYGKTYRVTGLKGRFLEVNDASISGLYYPIRFVKIIRKLSLEKL